MVEYKIPKFTLHPVKPPKDTNVSLKIALVEWESAYKILFIDIYQNNGYVVGYSNYRTFLTKTEGDVYREIKLDDTQVGERKSRYHRAIEAVLTEDLEFLNLCTTWTRNRFYDYEANDYSNELCYDNGIPKIVHIYEPIISDASHLDIRSVYLTNRVDSDPVWYVKFRFFNKDVCLLMTYKCRTASFSLLSCSKIEFIANGDTAAVELADGLNAVRGVPDSIYYLCDKCPATVLDYDILQ
jgi:hypothetical protein